MKIILGDNSTNPIKGFGPSNLNFGESVLLHDGMYVSGLKKNLVLIFDLENRVSFIKGKALTWYVGSLMRDEFTLGSVFE